MQAIERDSRDVGEITTYAPDVSFSLCACFPLFCERYPVMKSQGRWMCECTNLLMLAPRPQDHRGIDHQRCSEQMSVFGCNSVFFSPRLGLESFEMTKNHILFALKRTQQISKNRRELQGIFPPTLYCSYDCAYIANMSYHVISYRTISILVDNEPIFCQHRTKMSD